MEKTNKARETSRVTGEEKKRRPKKNRRFMSTKLLLFSLEACTGHMTTIKHPDTQEHTQVEVTLGGRSACNSFKVKLGFSCLKTMILFDFKPISYA